MEALTSLLPTEELGWSCKLFLNLLGCLFVSTYFSAVLTLFFVVLGLLTFFFPSECSLFLVTQTFS
jgi:hypothetical protein